LVTETIGVAAADVAVDVDNTIATTATASTNVQAGARRFHVELRLGVLSLVFVKIKRAFVRGKMQDGRGRIEVTIRKTFHDARSFQPRPSEMLL
jgi:hypothetical protein